MKKILLLTLPLMAVCFASCEKDNGNNGEELSGDDIIQFEDPNFLKALLYVQEIEVYDADTDDYVPYTVDVDENKDGQISVNEAKEVKGLVLYDYETEDSFNVRSMPEIKYFTSLETLYCYDNQLTTLDVSNNTALTALYCDENQLTSLDLSKNTALTYLSCGNNQLTSLDVSGCPALTSLYCWGNQLTSLDVSNNTALTYLDCDENQLTSLDVSKNTALTWLYCSGNQLTSLDLSKNTALTGLGCYDNQLTTLDVSNNNALRFLSCDNNQLTSLDLSKVSLQEFYCSGNPFTKIIINEKDISDYYLRSIIEEYGEDIIEYVE